MSGQTREFLPPLLNTGLSNKILSRVYLQTGYADE